MADMGVGAGGVAIRDDLGIGVDMVFENSLCI